MIQAILWDMDGVLVDTTDLHFWSWSVALQEQGLTFSHQEFLSTFGKNNFAILTQFFSPLSNELIQTISDRKEILFRENLDGKVVIFPGVLDWLEFAREQGIPCAVGSSAPMENITAILEHFSLKQYFAALVSASSLPSKPHPAVFLAGADALKIPYQNCLVVEDAPPGAMAARSAGMQCLVVLTTRTRPEFTTGDLFLERLSEKNPLEVLNKFDQAG